MTRYYETHDRKSANILPFPSPKPPAKRGRPKALRTGTDTGTPELIMKKLLGETAETLDLLLEHSLINKEQHWSGIHLRWLYTLRYGAPSIRTLDHTHTGGIEIKPEDPEWRAAREMEYHEAMRKLTTNAQATLMLNLCVHNERPRFLKKVGAKKRYTQAEAQTLLELRQGLDLLSDLWRRDKRPKA